MDRAAPQGRAAPHRARGAGEGLRVAGGEGTRLTQGPGAVAAGPAPVRALR